MTGKKLSEDGVSDRIKRRTEMNYQWYPGHMTKAKRAMQEDIRLIDLIIELVDARMPLGSRNPDIDSLGRQKARLVLLNKADLADPAVNREWIGWFEGQGVKALEINAQTGQGMKQIQNAVREVCSQKIERDRKRGIKNRPVRAMVAGIPNVGKSTFINSFAGKACTKTGNRPGVTKGKQWIRLNKELELLDTPGILWPKFEDQQVGMHLAFIGSMNDEIIVMEELALSLIEFLQKFVTNDRFSVYIIKCLSRLSVGEDIAALLRIGPVHQFQCRRLVRAGCCDDV